MTFRVLHSALEMVTQLRFWSIGGVLVLLTTPWLAAQDFTSGVVQLAAKISERSKPASASIAVTNRSSIGASSVSSIHDELVRQFQLRGWNLQSAGGEASIAVTLSETSHNYVWTAEITRAGARDVAILELPRSRGPASTQTGVTLSQTLLISSDTPLLDIALVEGNISEGAHLLALTPVSVELYQLQSSQWRLLQNQPLRASPLASRDLRGRVVTGENRSFDAFLPGLRCSGISTETISFTCGQSDDPWPLTDDRRVLAFYAANRNFFNGVLSGTNAQNGNVNPFFSAAVLSDRVIYADVDGVHYEIVLNGQPPVSIRVQRGRDRKSVV